MLATLEQLALSDEPTADYPPVDDLAARPPAEGLAGRAGLAGLAGLAATETGHVGGERGLYVRLGPAEATEALKECVAGEGGGLARELYAALGEAGAEGLPLLRILAEHAGRAEEANGQAGGQGGGSGPGQDGGGGGGDGGGGGADCDGTRGGGGEASV